MGKKSQMVNEIVGLSDGQMVTPNDALNIVENMFQCDSLFTSQYEEHITNEDGTEVVVYNGKFHLYGNHKGKSELRITDENLLKSTSKIMTGKRTGELVSRVLCRELYNIETAGTYRSMGFKSIGDYGSKLFDLKSVTCSQYVRIGKYFINDDYSDVSSFTDTLTVSHLLELLAYVNEESDNPIKEIELAFANGTINDCMSCRDMRNALKSHFKGNIDEDNSKDTKDTKNTKESKDSKETKSTHEPSANSPLDTSLIEKRTMALSLLAELPVTDGMPEVDEELQSAIDIVMNWLKG